MKRCGKCKLEIPLTGFSKNGGSRDGLQAYCKRCNRAYAVANRERISSWGRKWYQANKEHSNVMAKEWRLAHLDYITEVSRKWYLANREKAISDSRARRKANPQAQSDLNRRWRLANPERKAKTRTAYYEANKERLRECGRKWKLANPDKVQASHDRRRANKHAAFVEYVDREIVAKRDHDMCGICQMFVEKNEASLDHVIPLSKGGKHSYVNIQLAHRRCNSRKSCRILAAA